MRIGVVFGCLFLLSCGNNAGDDDIVSFSRQHESSQVLAADTNLVTEKDTTSYHSYATPSIKKPSGIYQVVLSQGQAGMVHTIEFYATTFRLQEEYPVKDSVTITEGTWSPSQGFIWLYKDQLAHGRYAWKGDTLQHYDPGNRKRSSMTKLTPVTANPVWAAKKQKGSALYGIGTEPFWSFEILKQDSAILNFSDWNQPLRLKLSGTHKTRDSVVYRSDSDSLTISIYPFFCSDGMSDFIYPNKLAVRYKGQAYTGCGVLF